MNKNETRVPARFGPETRFEVRPAPPAPFRATQETEFERLKSRLLARQLAEAPTPELNPPLRRAANEVGNVQYPIDIGARQTKHPVGGDTVEEVVFASLDLDAFPGFHGMDADAFVQFLAVAALLDVLHPRDQDARVGGDLPARLDDDAEPLARQQRHEEFAGLFLGRKNMQQSDGGNQLPDNFKVYFTVHFAAR